MKRVLHTIVLWVFPLILMGQRPEMKTLLKEETRISGFGSISVGFIPSLDTYTSTIGGDAAIVLNAFHIGGYGSRTLGSQTVPLEDAYYLNKKLELTQGGITTGISFGSKGLIQGCASTQFGWGQLLLRDINTKEILSRDRIHILTPMLQAKLNITSFIQLCAGVSYQFVFGVDYNDLHDDDFRGIGGLVSLRFGWF